MNARRFLFTFDLPLSPPKNDRAKGLEGVEKGGERWEEGGNPDRGKEGGKKGRGEEKRRGWRAPPPSPSISPLPLSLLFLLLSLGGETWWPAPFATSPASSCSPHQPGCCSHGLQRGRRLPDGICTEKDSTFFPFLLFLKVKKKELARKPRLNQPD